MDTIIYVSLLHTVNSYYRGIIGINLLSVDRAGMTTYYPQRKIEIKYDKAAKRLAPLQRDSNQKRLSVVNWDYSLFAQ